MRVSQAPLSQIPATPAGVAQRPLLLTPGQRLLVTVLANDNGLLRLLAESGSGASRTITARSELPLAPGQQLPVIVAGNDGAQIVLRLADGQGVLSPVTPEDIAQSLALPADQPWQAVLTALVRDSLPLTRELAEQVMTLWRRSGLPQPEPAALLWLAQRGISPTPERLALVKAFRRAHQGHGEPPDDAVMATVDVPGESGPMQFSIWMAGIDEPVGESERPKRRKPDGEGGTTEPPAAQAPGGHPAVVLLSVSTAKLGTIEALVEVAGEHVAVTCFSEDADAVRALATEVESLRTSLAAAGLIPGALTARSPEAGRDVPASLRRLDMRI